MGFKLTTTPPREDSPKEGRTYRPQVFSFFFLAAGNRTLFRMSR